MSALEAARGYVTRAFALHRSTALEVPKQPHPAILLMQQHLEQHGTTVEYPEGSPRAGHQHRFALLRIDSAIIALTAYSRPLSETEQEDPLVDLADASAVFATWVVHKGADKGQTGVVKLLPSTNTPGIAYVTQTENVEGILGDWNHGKGVEYHPNEGSGKVNMGQFVSMLEQAAPDTHAQQAASRYLQEMHISPFVTPVVEATTTAHRRIS